jgi:hypothetical protein
MNDSMLHDDVHVEVTVDAAPAPNFLRTRQGPHSIAIRTAPICAVIVGQLNCLPLPVESNAVPVTVPRLQCGRTGVSI